MLAHLTAGDENTVYIGDGIDQVVGFVNNDNVVFELNATRLTSRLVQQNVVRKRYDLSIQRQLQLKLPRRIEFCELQSKRMPVKT